MRHALSVCLYVLPPQVPFACYYTPDCKGHNRYLYHMSPGLIAIYPTNLTNADAWVKESNWLLDRKVGGDGMSSNHMCCKCRGCRSP